MYLICLSILLSNVLIQGMHQDASQKEIQAVGSRQQSLLADYINVASGCDLRPKKNPEHWANVVSALNPLSFQEFRVLTFMADQKKALIKQEADQAAQVLLSFRSMPVDETILALESFCAGPKQFMPVIKPIVASKAFHSGPKQLIKKKAPKGVIIIDKRTA
jgi:hypothetical protein